MPQPRYTSSDFLFIKQAGYDATYEAIETAMGYYEKDPKVCCDYFRQPLESTMNDVGTIMQNPPSLP